MEGSKSLVSNGIQKSGAKIFHNALPFVEKGDLPVIVSGSPVGHRFGVLDAPKGAEMPYKALANCCSHSGLRREFPQHTFREWHRAGTHEIKSDFLARSQAQISGS